jgi:hypothetical protein
MYKLSYLIVFLFVSKLELMAQIPIITNSQFCATFLNPAYASIENNKMLNVFGTYSYFNEYKQTGFNLFDQKSRNSNASQSVTRAKFQYFGFEAPIKIKRGLYGFGVSFIHNKLNLYDVQNQITVSSSKKIKLKNEGVFSFGVNFKRIFISVDGDKVYNLHVNTDTMVNFDDFQRQSNQLDFGMNYTGFKKRFHIGLAVLNIFEKRYTINSKDNKYQLQYEMGPKLTLISEYKILFNEIYALNSKILIVSSLNISGIKFNYNSVLRIKNMGFGPMVAKQLNDWSGGGVLIYQYKNLNFAYSYCQFLNRKNSIYSAYHELGLNYKFN